MQAGPHWWHKHWLFILEQTMMEGGMQGGSGGGQQAGGGGDLAQAAMLNFGKDFMRQHMEGRLEKAAVARRWIAGTGSWLISESREGALCPLAVCFLFGCFGGGGSERGGKQWFRGGRTVCRGNPT